MVKPNPRYVVSKAGHVVSIASLCIYRKSFDPLPPLELLTETFKGKYIILQLCNSLFNSIVYFLGMLIGIMVGSGMGNGIWSIIPGAIIGIIAGRFATTGVRRVLNV